jgi:flavodoxin I
MKISVIYWSGSGNTEVMAKALYEGASENATASLLSVDKASVADALDCDVLALGCPAMGAEVLEEAEMEPFISKMEKKGVFGKPLVLFGSYDWGDGEWMRNWQDRMEKAGATLVHECIISRNAPEGNMLETLRDAGRTLGKSVKPA